MSITYEMVDHCIDHPMKSRNHEFTGNEQREYDMLKARGRTLYDNLRTQFNIEHVPAYVWALDLYGKKGS